MLCERVPTDSRVQTVSVLASTSKMFCSTGVRHSRILRCYTAMSNVKESPTFRRRMHPISSGLSRPRKIFQNVSKYLPTYKA